MKSNCSCFFVIVPILLFLSFVVEVVVARDITLQIINLTNEKVTIYWVNEQNEHGIHIAAYIEPWDEVHFSTYIGHDFYYYERDRVIKKSHKRFVNVKGNPDGSGNKQTHLILEETTETMNVQCQTSQGKLNVVVKPQWSPFGARRFLELVYKGYYNGCALNRVVDGFLTQFGIGADYEKRIEYKNAQIVDDKIATKIPFKEGYMSYAGNGENSRTTEVFIVMPDVHQTQLDAFGRNPWETPFGYVTENDLQNVVRKWYSKYGDMPPWGRGPDPVQIYERHGYDYLKNEFIDLSYIQKCKIIRPNPDDANNKKEEL